jgi:hypothetical protein
MQKNVMAESVIDLGVQSLRLSPYERKKAYFASYAAMIQGILVNQFALQVIPHLRYSCLFRSSHTLGSYIRRSPTQHRLHLVFAQTLSAEVIGWVAKPVHIAFLMPMQSSTWFH